MCIPISAELDADQDTTGCRGAIHRVAIRRTGWAHWDTRESAEPWVIFEKAQML